jgi:hypothetical protein
VEFFRKMWMKLVKKMRNTSFRVLKRRRKDNRDGGIGSDKIHTRFDKTI